MAESDKRRLSGRRRRVLRDVRRVKDVDALLVSRPEDVGYLSGFTGEDSFLLVADAATVLITDGRYTEQASDECEGIEVFTRSGAMSEAVRERAGALGLKRLAVQSDHLTAWAMEQFVARLGKGHVVGVVDVVSKLRAVKDPQEIEATVRAIEVAQRASEEMLAQGASAWVGRTERQVAAELEYRMVCLGASKASFDTIVAAGAHSSLPHYRPGDRVIGRDEVVLVDWGAMVGGYCSDLTRVVGVGRIPPKLSEIHDVVLRAQSAAIEVIRPGASCRSADAAARKVIDQAGYGDGFLHGLGHGIGRQIHEFPGVGRQSTTRFRSGMIVTVEPGIYLPGVGGVRIEDDVLVTADGCRRLSSLARDLPAMTLRTKR